jgi:hypothetical protein
MEDNEDDRRAGFVDSLLSADHSILVASDDVMDCSLPEQFQKLHVQGNKNSTLAGFDSLVDSMFFHLSFLHCDRLC